MRMYSFGAIAVASAFALTIQVAPVSAQGRCGMGTCNSYRAAHAGATQPHYQNRGYVHGYGRSSGFGVGAGVAAGLAAGAIIGGAMQQNQGYYPVESYPVDSYPVYSDQVPSDEYAGAVVASDGDSVAYCQQTYRSYDLASGTYLGYDGLRHPCP